MPETKTDSLNTIFPISKYRDDFGWSTEWNEEINKWLSFANSCDTNWFNTNKNRVNREKQRDEFLGECKALYYIGEKLGCKIVQVEPTGKDDRKLDFLFEDRANNIWYVEVKSPSWMSVESKKIDARFPDSEQQRAEAKRKRWEMPQHIKGGGGSISEKDVLEDAVRKGSEQFERGKNNLLIITPNMVEGDLAIGLSKQFNGGPVRECIEQYDTERVISCAGILDVKLFWGEKTFRYDSDFVQSPMSTVSPEFSKRHE